MTDFIRAIDVCGGAGGWAVAARGLPIRITHAVDWWQPAVQTYALNHPDTLVVRADCRRLPIKPEGFDLILGGIPCQWLTVLRSALGNEVSDEEKARERELLDAILAFVHAVKPRYWCLEDVEQITAELPAFTPYHVLNAELWSGQRRVRAYVGQFPAPPLPRRRSGVMAERYLRPGPWRVHPKNLHRVVSLHGTWQKKENVYPVVPERKFPTVVTVGSRHDSKSCVVDTRLRTPGMRRIQGAEGTKLGERGELRRQIEWQEAAVAQGFPGDYVFVGSASDVAQMVANAVQIDTGREILRSIVADWRRA